MANINSISILENMKVSELKSIAKEAKLKGYSTLKKKDLISRIRKGHTIRNLKISELKSLARDYDIRSIYKLNKENLITNIIKKRKQLPFRKFIEDIFKTYNSSLNNSQFQNLEKTFFPEENYFNSSLEKTPEVYEFIEVI